MIEKHPYAKQFTEENFKEYFDNILIVFDSSVLLNLYELTTQTREQFLAVIKHPKINPFVWLPYTIVEEFLSNRERAIRFATKRIQDSYNDIFGPKGIFYSHLPDITESGESPNPINDLLLKEINSKKELLWEDRILNQLNEIYSDAKTGDPLKKSLIEAWRKEYDERIRTGVPTPGEKDQKKKHNREADFFIWRQLISKAKEENKNICFVTRDRKEDWWSIHEADIITEKISLLQEFYGETNQQIRIFNDIIFLETLLKFKLLGSIEEKLVVVLKKENQSFDNFDLNQKFNDMLKLEPPVLGTNLNNLLNPHNLQFLPKFANLLQLQPFGGLLGATKEMEAFARSNAEMETRMKDNLKKFEDMQAKSQEISDKLKDFEDGIRNSNGITN